MRRAPADTAIVFFNAVHAVDVDALWEGLPITTTPLVHRVWLRDRRASFYLRGVQGLGDSFPETVSALRRMLVRLGARRLVTVGSSSGGWAALTFGILLGADVILGFGAPTTGLPEHVREIGDHRAPVEYQQLVADNALDPSFVDSRKLLEHAERVPEVHLYYDRTHEIDSRHALHLEGVLERQLVIAERNERERQSG